MLESIGNTLATLPGAETATNFAIAARDFLSPMAATAWRWSAELWYSGLAYFCLNQSMVLSFAVGVVFTLFCVALYVTFTGTTQATPAHRGGPPAARRGGPPVGGVRVLPPHPSAGDGRGAGGVGSG